MENGSRSYRSYECWARKGGQLSANEVQEFTNVFARRLPFFYRIAMNRLGNWADAEDAIQDAFLSAFKHLNQFRGQAKLSTWLTTIVVNSARMKIRRRRRQLHISLARDDREQDDVPISEVLSDASQLLKSCIKDGSLRSGYQELLKQLSPTLRRTFQLRDVYGLSVRHTAQLLGLRETTVKAQLVRHRPQCSTPPPMAQDSGFRCEALLRRGSETCGLKTQSIGDKEGDKDGAHAAKPSLRARCQS
jgi:RNA polymerase sigma-70 factor, ECF subfamily